MRSHGSTSKTNPTDTLSSLGNGLGGGDGPGGSSVSLCSTTSSIGGSGTRFVKPTKSVSFAGEDNSDSTGATLVDHNNSRRTALEERSSSLSPPRGGRLALSQGMGYGGAGVGVRAGAAGSRSQIGGVDGVVEGSVPEEAELIEDGSWGFGEVGGDTTVGKGEIVAPVEGKIDNENEEEEMASFIVLDCSKVTNVSGSFYL